MFVGFVFLFLSFVFIFFFYWKKKGVIDSQMNAATNVNTTQRASSMGTLYYSPQLQLQRTSPTVYTWPHPSQARRLFPEKTFLAENY